MPKGYLPEEGINELWRANNLWNNLVAIHKKGQKDFQDARYSAHEDYAEVSDKLDDLNIKVDAAYESKHNARMKAATRDTSHPLIKAANDVIQDLKKQRREVYDEIKPLRKKADKLIDQIELTAEFRKACSHAISVKNTGGLASKTAEAVNEYFKKIT